MIMITRIIKETQIKKQQTPPPPKKKTPTVIEYTQIYMEVGIITNIINIRWLRMVYIYRNNLIVMDLTLVQ